MCVGRLIRQRRENLGLTQDQLAPQADISKPYLSNIETGKANPPRDHILKSLERALGFDPDQLTYLAHLARTPIDVRQRQEELEAQLQKLRCAIRELLHRAPRDELGELDLGGLGLVSEEGSSAGQLSAGVAVPVINKVAGGYPVRFTGLDYPPRVAEDYVRCPGLHDPQAFAARVVGDFMEPRYHQRDVVVFSPAVPVESGDDCFVRFEGDGRTTFRRIYRDDQRTVRLQPLNSKYPGESHPSEQISGLWAAVFRIERLRRA